MAGNLTAMIAAAFSGGAAPPVTSDPYYEYTTLLLPGNGTNGAQNNTFLDGSTNNFTITRNGNTTQGTFSPFSQTGWGNYFSGSGAYLSVASNAAFNLGTVFSVETFFYTTSTAKQVFFQLSGYVFYVESNKLTIWAPGSIGGTGTDVPINSWAHIVFTRDSSNQARAFVNGVLAWSASMTAASSQTIAYIGAENGSTSLVNGYMSNIRFVKGDIPTAYQTTSNTAGTTIFTPPTSPLTAISGTSLLTCQSNRFIDNSSNNFTITRNGNASVVAFSPFNPSASWSAATYGGSGYFDGSGDYLTVPSNAAFATPLDFTWEAWVYRTTTSDDVLYTGNVTDAFVVQIISNAVVIRQFGVANLITSSATVPAYAWTHIAVARSGTTLSLWINGSRTSGGTTTNSTSFAQNGLLIGVNDIGTNYLDGYLSGLRLVKGTAVYDPTQTSITVPTAPLTAITNTSLLLNFTNAGIYDATSKNDLETVGNAQISTTQSKWGGSSMYFDGTGDWLLSPASTLYAFNTGDFTIEGWVYIGATPANACLFDTRNGFGTGGFGVFITNGTGIAIYTSSGTTIFTATSCLTTSAWQHLAITRNGTNFRVFVNGTQISSTVTNSANMSDGYLIIANALAADRNYPFTGYIQDFRITKGYARYTANFTAPTAAFPTL